MNITASKHKIVFTTVKQMTFERKIVSVNQIDVFKRFGGSSKHLSRAYLRDETKHVCASFCSLCYDTCHHAFSE